MSEPASKLFSVGKILGGLAFCLAISLGIYLAAMFFVYSTGHCPSGDCQTKIWDDVIFSSMLLSPLPIFMIGAYLARNAVYSLTKNNFLRAVTLSGFAFFPILLLAALIICAAVSTD